MGVTLGGQQATYNSMQTLLAKGREALRIEGALCTTGMHDYTTEVLIVLEVR